MNFLYNIFLSKMNKRISGLSVLQISFCMEDVEIEIGLALGTITSTNLIHPCWSVTVKMRVGINSDHQTFLESAKSAADLGVTWVALHARTAAQLYEGRSDWNKITELVEHLSDTDVPVLGNGDIWSGEDAVNMINQTGCAGVVVGRGCLGRPWLFADLVSAINGENKRVNPNLYKVREIMIHQPSGGARGQATDMLIQVNEIMAMKKNLTEIYVKHNSKGKTFDVLQADMERDNFMSAQQALDYGLVDEIVTKRG